MIMTKRNFLFHFAESCLLFIQQFWLASQIISLYAADKYYFWHNNKKHTCSHKSISKRENYDLVLAYAYFFMSFIQKH